MSVKFATVSCVLSAATCAPIIKPEYRLPVEVLGAKRMPGDIRGVLIHGDSRPESMRMEPHERDHEPTKPGPRSIGHYMYYYLSSPPAPDSA